MTLGQSGRTREAVAQYREALRLNPNLAGALNNLAWVLAASPDDELRNGAEAVRLAERACELTHYGEPLFLGTLAAAYAECRAVPGSGGHGGKGGATRNRCRVGGGGGEKPAIARTLPRRQALS